MVITKKKKEKKLQNYDIYHKNLMQQKNALKETLQKK